MTTIRIACDGALVPWSELKVIQKDLKTLTKERFEELSRAIESDGFAYAVHYWVNPEGEKCILDGTQRYRVSTTNIANGRWADFQAPTIKVTAESFQAALKTLLHGASSYGTPDSQGYYELTEAAGLTVEDLKEVALSGIDQKKHEAEFYEDTEATEGEDEIPEPPKVARTKRGELWILGSHRLLIDDCTVKENVERLMAGEKADMVFTDPPYNIGLDYHEYDDTKAPDAFSSILKSCFTHAFDLLNDKGHCLFTMGHKWMFDCRDIVLNCGFEFRHLGIWHNPQRKAGGNPGMWPISYEAVLDFTKNGFRKLNNGNSVGHTDVWIESPTHETGHPAQKPIKLWQYLLELCTDKGNVVYEPFSGSGTTLIACEATGRISRGFELDPIYADVIISRWEKFSGLEAHREDGVGFSELTGETQAT